MVGRRPRGVAGRQCAPSIDATSMCIEEVERFTRVDYVNRLALVAEDNSGLVAVARYDRTPGTAEAEVAFVVADQYQHHGIGTLLLERLAAAAWQRGITAFVATTLAENREMLQVFADSVFQVTNGSTCPRSGTFDSIYPRSRLVQ